MNLVLNHPMTVGPGSMQRYEACRFKPASL